MATVQTLKDKNDNTFYPVTKTEAVYNADGSETLDNTINNLKNTKATISTDAGDANKVMMADGTKSLVNTANIANSAVTSSNIDFTTFNPLMTRAMIYIGSVNGGSGIAENTSVEFSSSSTGTKTNKFEFDPASCVALDSGTCKYTHVAGNSFLEVEMVVSGNYNTLWLKNTNHNTLPTGVSIIVNKMMGTKNTAGFGSSIFKLYYDVHSMTVGDSFYVNPEFTVYGGSARLNLDGTEGFMTVKVFGNG